MSSVATTVTPSINERRSRARFVRSGWVAEKSGESRAAVYRSADNFRFGQPEELAAGLWTRGLLDRLQEPITRYHE